MKSLYDLKKYNEAILQSKKCLKINSKSTGTLLLLGNLYNKLNQDKKSEKYFREILKINSEDSSAYYSLSHALTTEERLPVRTQLLKTK